VPLPDRGIFSALDRQVRLQPPIWLVAGPALVVRTADPEAALLHVAGVAVGFAGARGGEPHPECGPSAGIRHCAGPTVDLPRLGPAHDADGDGIPDPLDLLIGAKKAALNSARYVEGYRRIGYPGGDVPAGEGVCTDVVIRALRNAGHDLQRLVHEDIRRSRRSYPMVRRPDSNIDHRRVQTLLPYFRRHWRALPPDITGALEPLLPGDVVFLNTMGDERPDHIGIISDEVGPSGRPLVINNWTVGYRTSQMDLLASVPLTHRFRLRTPPLPAPARARGLQGLLDRRGVRVPDGHRQLLVVTAPLWNSSAGTLQRFVLRARGGGPPLECGPSARTRNCGQAWRALGPSVPVRLGAAGLGRGRGLHDSAAMQPGPLKREGDRRSPAGLFALGPALGRSERPYRGAWPWRRVDARDRLVDDPTSPHYNSWQRAPLQGRPAWRSAESLAGYRLALWVLHNTNPVQPGAGSAIFLHLPDATGGPTVGCTALPRRALVQILGWLDPGAKPLLLQLPGQLL